MSELIRKLGRSIGGSFRSDGTITDLWYRNGPDEPKVHAQTEYAVRFYDGETEPYGDEQDALFHAKRFGGEAVKRHATWTDWEVIEPK